MLRFLSRLLWVLVAIPALTLLLVVINYFLITLTARGHMVPAVKPESRITWILLPGAGNSEPGKWVNHTFEHRMEAAHRIWQSDHHTRFIASGMIRPPYYDEPADMKERLMEYGIPDSVIICDSLGTRTWNSVRHAGLLAGSDRLVIVSQKEHLERALFCASCQGFTATGYVAEPPPYAHRFWTYREYLARAKATWDCVAFRLKNK